MCCNAEALVVASGTVYPCYAAMTHCSLRISCRTCIAKVQLEQVTPTVVNVAVPTPGDGRGEPAGPSFVFASFTLYCRALCRIRESSAIAPLRARLDL